MFFSLTALGPASLGLPPARAATARSAATGRPGARAASPRSWAGRAGGRPAGQAAAMPGTALLCGRVLRPPPFRPPQACSGQAAPPAARRSATLRPTRGTLTFWAPASGPRVLLAPGVPGHVLGAAAACPTRLPALGGEPGTVPSCLGARPGLGNFPARVCVGRGAGCGDARGG